MHLLCHQLPERTVSCHGLGRGERAGGRGDGTGRVLQPCPVLRAALPRSSQCLHGEFSTGSLCAKVRLQPNAAGRAPGRSEAQVTQVLWAAGGPPELVGHRNGSRCQLLLHAWAQQRHLFHRAPGVFPQGVSAPWGPPSARTAAHTGWPQPTTAPGSEDFALQECDPVPKTQPEHHGVRSSPGSRRKELHEEVACPAPGPADGAHRSLAGLTQAVW